MTIKELSEKYSVDKRTIDYWTTLGLIRYNELENGYRDYGIDGEEDLRKCIIIDAMGVKDRNAYFDLLDHLPNDEWDEVVVKKIEKRMEEAVEMYKRALNYVKCIRGE